MESNSKLSVVLRNVFTYPPSVYKHVHDKLIGLYKLNNKTFADIFFDVLLDMNPKTLRIIAYQLYAIGVNLETLYNQRSLNTTPTFLYHLDKFSSESLLVLLRYKFPHYPDGNLFISWSLSKQGKWLEFALDLCNHFNIDINKINSEPRRTVLHSSILERSMSTILLLLCHGANPNVVDYQGYTPLNYALDSFNKENINMTLPININIVKQLRRYGSKVDNISREYIQKSGYRSKLENILIWGKRMTPYYCDSSKRLFSLNTVEDISMLLMADSSISKTQNFKDIFGDIDSDVLNESLKSFNETKKSKDNRILKWPYYIDESKETSNLCKYPLDDNISVEPLPNTDDVYALATRNLEDVSEKDKVIHLSFIQENSEYNSIPTTPEYTDINIHPLPKSFTEINLNKKKYKCGRYSYNITPNPQCNNGSIMDIKINGDTFYGWNLMDYLKCANTSYLIKQSKMFNISDSRTVIVGDAQHIKTQRGKDVKNVKPGYYNLFIYKNPNSIETDGSHLDTFYISLHNDYKKENIKKLKWICHDTFNTDVANGGLYDKRYYNDPLELKYIEEGQSLSNNKLDKDNKWNDKKIHSLLMNNTILSHGFYVNTCGDGGYRYWIAKNLEDEVVGFGFRFC